MTIKIILQMNYLKKLCNNKVHDFELVKGKKNTTFILPNSQDLKPLE